MKKGDKILCIKDLIIKKDIDNPYKKDFQEIVMKLHNEEITFDEFSTANKEYNEKKKEYYINITELTKNKVYEIVYVLWDGTLRIKGNNGNIHFSVNDKKSEYSSYRYEDFFVTLVEARKKKLDDLADENFNQFLKKIKK